MAIDKNHPIDSPIVLHPLADSFRPPMSPTPTRAPEAIEVNFKHTPAERAEERNERILQDMLQAGEVEKAVGPLQEKLGDTPVPVRGTRPPLTVIERVDITEFNVAKLADDVRAIAEFLGMDLD